MENATVYPWPLQPGHLFGPNNYDLRYHTGRESLTDTQALARWQRAYSERISRRRIQMTGRYDGDTQRAVIHIQQLAGLPVTGTLDRETWEAVWTVDRPPRPQPPTPPDAEPKRPVGSIKRVPRHDRSKVYWRRYSRAGVEYGTVPDAPPWYPGKPFGPHEEGWHVRMVQEILGQKPSGRYTLQLMQRVRGVQRMNGLPISGVVDAETARVLDPGPW